MAKRDTCYEIWMREEGIPVVEGYGVKDVRELTLQTWPRTGGKGAFIDLKGMEGFTGMYVGEIPAGGALNPENRLYEELIYIIQGIGATELWSAGEEKRKMHFEWQQGSLFAIPLNTRHRPVRMISTDGARILASERFIQTYQSSASYAEMMGYPANQLATDYWFPWYNNISYSTQLRVSNMGSNSAEIKVYAGSSTTPVDTFTLAGGETKRIAYNIDNGPLRVVSTDGVTPILASERFILTFGSSASYAEMMGYSGDQLFTEYCFPWYNNTTDEALTLSSQLRVSNMGSINAQVKVYLAGGEIDSFSLDAGQGARKSYATYNNGPLCVVSADGTTPILASERFISTNSLAPTGGRWWRIGGSLQGEPGNRATVADRSSRSRGRERDPSRLLRRSCRLGYDLS